MSLPLSGIRIVSVEQYGAGPFATLHLADLGAPPEFTQAGVAGMMDLVASLEWVRDNIEKFGGDPSKVMIFGQSGGGAKTSTMLAMPSAKGLFHSAGIQSGSTIRSATREIGTRSAEGLLAKLGIAKSNIADDGVQHLIKLSRLKELDLSDTKVTPGQIAQLQKSLPHCRIIPSVVPPQPSKP